MQDRQFLDKHVGDISEKTQVHRGHFPRVSYTKAPFRKVFSPLMISAGIIDGLALSLSLSPMVISGLAIISL